MWRGEGRRRGEEEGRAMVAIGLSSGPEERRCSRLAHRPAQAAHPGGRQQGRGRLGQHTVTAWGSTSRTLGPLRWSV